MLDSLMLIEILCTFSIYFLLKNLLVILNQRVTNKLIC
jgi:hypothetical protein